MSTPATTLHPGRPVHEIRLGSVKVSIWKNPTEHGARHSLRASRLYKDGENWKSTDSFGRDDLLALAKVIDEAHTWIWRQEHAANQ